MPKRFRQLILLVAMLAVSNCAQKPITSSADPSIEILKNLESTTKNHYASLIKNYGTEECRRRSSSNEAYWKQVNGDLLVLRAWNFETDNLARKEMYVPLAAAFEASESFERAVDVSDGNITSTGQVSHCVDPETAVRQAELVVPTISRMARALGAK